MKITLVHFAYAPVVGGVERVIEEHARLFAANGHEVTVFCYRGASADPRVRIVHLPAENCAATLRPVLAASDIVFLHNVATMPFHMALTTALAQLADELSAVRFIAWVHDIAACNPDLELVSESLRQAHPRYRYIAVSELRARQFYEMTGVECAVIPNGLDIARVLALPANVARFAEEFLLFDGRLVLLHPTRLLRRKNVELSLAITAELKACGHSVALLITGAEDPYNPVSRDYAEWLRAERVRLGIEREAVFIGEYFEIADAELAALYGIADALIFPSRSEGFGLPVLEAAIHRLPIFAADIEPLRTVAPASTTFFDPCAPAIAIAALISSRLAANTAHLVRKATLVHSSWSAIYNKHLAPLLIS